MDKDQENNLPDIEMEEEESADISTIAKVKKLREELKKCQSERAEYLAGWQRAKADYINLKREEEKNRTETIRYAKESLLADLLNLADSFELAFSNKTAWEQAPENWRKGVEYIYSELLNIFRDNDLEEIDPLGKKFNPQEHQSVGTIETTHREKDDIIEEVVKKGYRLNGKIIRPAYVKTLHFKDKED